MCYFKSWQRSFVLALVTVLAISEMGLAGPLGRGRRSYNPVSNLGIDTGAFAGPYRGGYGRGYRNWNYGYNYGYGPYYSGYAYPDYTYPVPSYSPPVDTEQRSYYPPPQPATPAPTTATIELYVPANAEVWFQGKKTSQTGTLRRFVTPPLNSGSEWSYELRVRWTDANGEVQEKTREVSVHPGSQVVLNLQEAPKK